MMAKDGNRLSLWPAIPAVVCLASLVPAAETKPIFATVKRVVDGDTIIVMLKNGKEERVSLLCVNTEEIVHPEQ